MAKGKMNNNGTDKWNKTAQKHPHKYSQLVFGKAAEAVLEKQWSSQHSVLEQDIHTQKNLYTDLALFTKINSKWIIDLEAIKLLEDNEGENLDKTLDKI